jgi:hypothetical protein
MTPVKGRVERSTSRGQVVTARVRDGLLRGEAMGWKW